MSRLRHLWLTLRLSVPPLAWLTLLIGLCAAVGGLWLQHDQASLAARQLEAARSHARAAQRGAAPKQATRLDSREARLERVFAALKQHGVLYRQIAYRYSENGALTLELALDASYPQVKALLAQLGAQPGIGVQRLSLKRDQMQQAQLAVALHLTLEERS